MDEQVPAVEAAQSAPPPAAEPTAPQPAQAEPVQSNEQSGPPESIPYGRFQEVNEEKKALEEKLAQYEQPQYQEPSYQPYQQPFQQSQPQQNPYLDPNTGEVDPQAFTQYNANLARNEAVQAVEARLAWDKMERENPDLSDNRSKSILMGIVYAESQARGKLITPSDAAKLYKEDLGKAQKAGAAAQTEQVQIQDSARLAAPQAPANETVSSDADLQQIARTSPDMKQREAARLQIIKQSLGQTQG